MDIKELIKGEKYTIFTDNILGDQVSIKVTFLAIKNYGFDTEEGAWALYGNVNETPATFLICKRFRKKKCSVFNTKFIISIEKGW